MSVYFVRVGEYIKIGYSKDPIARSGTVTRNGKRPDDVPFGADVDLIGWIPGDEWRERELHVQYMEHRVRGEWFRLEREVAEGLIWGDPRGVDLEQMSGMAVFVCMRFPDLTREQIGSAGVQIEGTPLEEVYASLDMDAFNSTRREVLA